MLKDNLQGEVRYDCQTDMKASTCFRIFPLFIEQRGNQSNVITNSRKNQRSKCIWSKGIELQIEAEPVSLKGGGGAHEKAKGQGIVCMSSGFQSCKVTQAP